MKMLYMNCVQSVDQYATVYFQQKPLYCYRKHRQLNNELLQSVLINSGESISRMQQMQLKSENCSLGLIKTVYRP